MPLLILGFSLVFAGLLGWGVAAEFNGLQYQTRGIPLLVGAILIAPVIGAWIAAEFVNLLTPRRILDPRRRTAAARLGVGIAAGVCSATAGAGILPLVDLALPDAAILGLTSLAVMGGFLASCSRIRPGFCIHCRYDLRNSAAPGQPGAGRCPECGATIGPAGVGLITSPAVP